MNVVWTWNEFVKCQGRRGRYKFDSLSLQIAKQNLVKPRNQDTQSSQVQKSRNKTRQVEKSRNTIFSSWHITYLNLITLRGPLHVDTVMMTNCQHYLQLHRKPHFYIAIIKVNIHAPVPMEKMGDSNAVRPSKFVVAVGSPPTLPTCTAWRHRAKGQRNLESTGDVNASIFCLGTIPSKPDLPILVVPLLLAVPKIPPPSACHPCLLPRDFMLCVQVWQNTWILQSINYIQWPSPSMQLVGLGGWSCSNFSVVCTARCSFA